jgi:hypothetical protein
MPSPRSQPAEEKNREIEKVAAKVVGRRWDRERLIAAVLMKIVKRIELIMQINFIKGNERPRVEGPQIGAWSRYLSVSPLRHFLAATLFLSVGCGDMLEDIVRGPVEWVDREVGPSSISATNCSVNISKKEVRVGVLAGISESMHQHDQEFISGFPRAHRGRAVAVLNLIKDKEESLDRVIHWPVVLDYRYSRHKLYGLKMAIVSVRDQDGTIGYGGGGGFTAVSRVINLGYIKTTFYRQSNQILVRQTGGSTTLKSCLGEMMVSR